MLMTSHKVAMNQFRPEYAEQVPHERRDALGLALGPVALLACEVDVDVHIAVRDGTGFVGVGFRAWGEQLS